MNTDNLLLILVFLFAQNKRLMQDVKPVLDFLDEHQNALNVLQQLLNQQKSAGKSSEAEPASKTETKTETAREENEENEKTQSPLRGIANEDILKNIHAYLDSQAR